MTDVLIRFAPVQVLPATENLGTASACCACKAVGQKPERHTRNIVREHTVAIEPETVDTLITLRDWLRFAVSRFNAARLVYGHGTSNAFDEAAFVLLATLDLPVDQLEPWLDARLTRPERQRLADIIEARITTRKPAPYLTNCAYIRGRRFYVDHSVIVPRSYIGELLEGGLDGIVDDAASIGRVLDLCTGGGSLAILAALAFPNAHVDALDISPEALHVAARNVADYSLGDRITLIRSNLFAALEGQRYDLILSNPPNVTEAAVAAFPPEYKAEPVLAHLGGADGMDLVRDILANAAEHLESTGHLVVEVGMGQVTLAAEYAHLRFLWLDTEESEGEVFALPAESLQAKAQHKKPRK